MKDGIIEKTQRQFEAFKKQYPGYVLFFRVGDFYECFREDAATLATTCGVALTSRTVGLVPDAVMLAGVPFHAVESYLRKMIAAGHRCAVCEQVAA